MDHVITILVTGGAGYIGSHTVQVLADAGLKVVVIDNLSTGFSASVPLGTPLVVGDAGDRALLEQTITSHEIRSIIHFAGSVVVEESVRNPLAYYQNNTMATRNLLSVAVKLNIEQLIFSSTAAVYGNPEKNPVSEEAPTQPLSPYGWSKLMSEVMLNDVASAHGLRFVVLRYFNVAGADPHGRRGLSKVGSTHLLKIAVEAATGQRTGMDVFGTDYATADGSCIRDFIHVGDLAEAHLSAHTYLREGGRSATLNCGYGRGYSVIEVIESVRRISGRDFPVRISDRRPGDCMAVVADPSRIRRRLAGPRNSMIWILLSSMLSLGKRSYSQKGNADRESKAGEEVVSGFSNSYGRSIASGGLETDLHREIPPN